MRINPALASSLLGVLLLVLSPTALARGTPVLLEPFPTAQVGAWALPSIAFLSAEGILHGVTPGKLDGSDLVTQEQAITLIGRTLGWSPKRPKHPDPQVDAFAQPYVAMAQALGVVPTFPRAPTSRLQAAQWLVTFLKLPAATIQNPFTDVPQALEPSILSAVQAGIVQGTSPTTFTPLGEVTRAEFVAMLFSAQLAETGSGALLASGATYFARSGLALVRSSQDTWTLVAGSQGLRSINGSLRAVAVQDKGRTLTLTQTLPGGPGQETITVQGNTLSTPSGQSVTLPPGVPPTAGLFLLPLP